MPTETTPPAETRLNPTVEAARKHLDEFCRLLQGLPSDEVYPEYAIAVMELRRLWKIAIGYPKMNEYEAQARIDKGGRKP